MGSDISNVVSDLMTWHQMTIPGAPIPVPYPEVVGKLMRATPKERQSLIPGLLGDVAAFLYTRIEGNLPVDSLMITARFEPVPNPDSRVTLIGQRDAVGMPRAELDWQLSDADRHNVRRTMEIFGAEMVFTTPEFSIAERLRFRLNAPPMEPKVNPMPPPEPWPMAAGRFTA